MGAAASAAPPPPPDYPAGLSTEVGGYRMDRIYPVYFFWLNRQRKDALFAAVKSPQEWRGLNFWNRVIESEIVSYDYDVVRADRLDRYCEGISWKNEPSGNCTYRYTYAFVPGSPWSDPAVVKAISSSFRADELARRLKSTNWEQSSDSWSSESLRAAFAAHAKPQEVFAPLVRTVEVSGYDCPALTKAIGELGKITRDLAPEAVTDPVDAMAPHGSRTEARLWAADAEGRAIILHAATPLHGQLRPIWNAVKGCAPPPK